MSSPYMRKNNNTTTSIHAPKHANPPSWSKTGPSTLRWSAHRFKCLLLRKCLKFWTEMKMQQNVYSYFVSGKRKTDVLWMWTKGSLRHFWGLFCWNYSENCFMMSRSWGLYMWVCVCCMCACICVCACVCVWACRHGSRQVINQHKCVTLSSAWKPSLFC